MRLNLNIPVKFLLTDKKTFTQHRWFRPRAGRIFAVTRIIGKEIELHRFVLPVEGSIQFRDGNPLNVTKANLIVKLYKKVNRDE